MKEKLPKLVKIKKNHPDAKIPAYAKRGDAGMDLTAIGKDVQDKYIEYDTGLSMEIPVGYVGLLFPRSSISNYDLTLSNSVGVVDSGYRGNIKFRFKQTSDLTYYIGDRIGQIIIIPHPHIQFVEVDELSDSERGSGGYGHTGIK